TVREELHKAGWRLADLLTQAVTSTSTSEAAAPIPPEPMPAQPISPPPSAAHLPTAAQTSSALRPGLVRPRSSANIRRITKRSSLHGCKRTGSILHGSTGKATQDRRNCQRQAGDVLPVIS